MPGQDAGRTKASVAIPARRSLLGTSRPRQTARHAPCIKPASLVAYLFRPAVWPGVLHVSWNWRCVRLHVAGREFPSTSRLSRMSSRARLRLSKLPPPPARMQTSPRDADARWSCHRERNRLPPQSQTSREFRDPADRARIGDPVSALELSIIRIALEEIPDWQGAFDGSSLHFDAGWGGAGQPGQPCAAEGRHESPCVACRAYRFLYCRTIINPPARISIR